MKDLHSLSCLLGTCILVAIGLFILPMASSYAAVPQLINYQGKLTKVSGAPVDTTISMVYTIYSDSNGITSKWSETQTSVKVEKGIFNVLLGSTNAIPDSVFDGTIRYLGVKVGGDPEITPRKAMVSVPYAYRAGSGGGGSDNKWIFRITDTADTSITTGGNWGIARRGATLLGDMDSTHVNLGVACTTGIITKGNKYCTVAGGLANTASESATTVGGGYHNIASGFISTVAGGDSNTASASLATVGGGHNNLASGDVAIIGGGYRNAASGFISTVAGGDSNTAGSDFATVGGGHNNNANGIGSTVGGGDENTASGNYAIVGGGYLNVASNMYVTVGGGENNTANGSFATVGGGSYNSNSGASSTIPGGDYDTLTTPAAWSMAFGHRVYVNNNFRVVFYDGTTSGRLGINRDDHDGGILYPIHVGTSASNGNGAYLTNGGVWTNGSSRTFKEKFQPLNSQELLEKISSLPVESWNYKNSSERHIGPVAEDFVSAFDVGVIREDGVRDNKYLSTEDIAGVALAGVKELIKENQDLRLMIEQLKRSNTLLEDRLTHVEKTR